MKKLAFIIIAVVASSTLFAQKKVELITAVDNTQSNMVYYLPRTVLEVRVEATRTVQKAGPFAKHAKKEFGFEDAQIILKDNVIYEISSIEIITSGVPDLTKLYKVTASPTSKANILQLNEVGIIQGINAPYRRTESAFVNEIQTIESENNTAIFFDKSELPEDFFSSSLNEQMFLALNKIYQFREAKYDLLSGYADNLPSDAVTLQLMLDELKRRENSVMELFKGKSITTTEKKTFRLIPTRLMNDHILFHFSPETGFTTEEDGTAVPHFLSLQATRAKTQQNNDAKSTPKTGFFYIIPQNVNTKIYTKEKTLHLENIPMAQFGQTVSLPVNFVDKNDVSIIFDTTTGAIQINQSR